MLRRYLFGLMCAYMVFVPLSEPDSIDLLTLQRLVEVTFRNDFNGLRYASVQHSPAHSSSVVSIMSRPPLLQSYRAGACCIKHSEPAISSPCRVVWCRAPVAEGDVGVFQ